MKNRMHTYRYLSIVLAVRDITIAGSSVLIWWQPTGFTCTIFVWKGNMRHPVLLLQKLWMRDRMFAIALFFHCKPVISLVDLSATANITVMFYGRGNSSTVLRQYYILNIWCWSVVAIDHLRLHLECNYNSNAQDLVICKCKEHITSVYVH